MNINLPADLNLAIAAAAHTLFVLRLQEDEAVNRRREFLNKADTLELKIHKRRQLLTAVPESVRQSSEFHMATGELAALEQMYKAHKDLEPIYEKLAADAHEKRVRQSNILRNLERQRDNQLAVNNG